MPYLFEGWVGEQPHDPAWPVGINQGTLTGPAVKGMNLPSALILYLTSYKAPPKIARPLLIEIC
jgi:hypothetical protein